MNKLRKHKLHDNWAMLADGGSVLDTFPGLAKQHADPKQGSATQKKPPGAWEEAPGHFYHPIFLLFQPCWGSDYSVCGSAGEAGIRDEGVIVRWSTFLGCDWCVTD